MSPRYVIARKDSDLVGMAIPVCDLPDAEHVHLHRQADGTYTAVPMEAVKGSTWALMLYADAPTGGDA